MGYRSEIGLCLSAEALVKLRQKLANTTLGAAREEIESLLGCGNKVSRDAALWYWDNLKWYTDFPDVQFIENFLNDLDDSDYLFIRIGESEDDCEIRGCYYDNPFGMCLTRAISFDEE